MKKILVLTLFISFLGYAQKDSIQVKLNNKIVPFVEIEQVPIFPKCKGNKKELTKCLNLNIRKHINKHFNIDLAQNLDLFPGRKRISVQFLIDKKGFVTDIRSKAPHRKLQKEAVRIVKLLPQMVPGKQKGKPVRVRYNLPIVFNVEESLPLSKAQLKALKRKRKKAAQAKRLKKFSE